MSAELQPAPTVETALYPDLESWVGGYFTPMFLHRVDGTRARWCARWWDHAEAIARLTLLWHTWETARHRPDLKPGWWLDLDHHLPILLAADGPFRTCRTGHGDRTARHQPAPPPASTPAPAGWW
jgi:hypothetical protein